MWFHWGKATDGQSVGIDLVSLGQWLNVWCWSSSLSVTWEIRRPHPDLWNEKPWGRGPQSVASQALWVSLIHTQALNPISGNSRSHTPNLNQLKTEMQQYAWVSR